jgi:hypothetical protein
MAEKIFQNIPAVSDMVDMQLKVTIEEQQRCFLEMESFLGSVYVFCKDTTLRKVPFNR